MSSQVSQVKEDSGATSKSQQVRRTTSLSVLPRSRSSNQEHGQKGVRFAL